jgi:manganese/zinc/iron transport system permease protein
MATTCGVLFAAAFLLAPRRGLLVQMRRRHFQRLEFGVTMLLVHLLHHEHTQEAREECRRITLHHHLLGEASPPGRTRGRLRGPVAGRLVALTDPGRDRAQHAVVGE